MKNIQHENIKKHGTIQHADRNMNIIIIIIPLNWSQKPIPQPIMKLLLLE